MPRCSCWSPSGSFGGLLFVPCAGPVLAAIAVVGATHRIGAGAVVLTIAFGIGVGVPLLLFAFAGDTLARRTSALRARAAGLRRAGGGWQRSQGRSGREGRDQDFVNAA
ncbi:cytochrome c biogenesis protein CcdA [Pseudonocardia sp. GCM10023141]|uniref:cytochrome c biogenesis protein CcdA n=1 Tax=Pseudonocardia sp. GCM10023141 TaxID=3252653 RepID=UPI003619617A